ncbi:spore cortex biosynthesis protein YabQ [Bacillus sp. FJAT-49736]|uniref:spore cortex biosynthesis protein YabQ n=1 Tax=Bacillus sp. FJAT-49736 TaxID=2833582 RepID=UPI001BC8EB8D|nr:spore cortex biosynthesis protein YabQ [Bacillus sp. FJAT-49736]MBS4175762.1 spore cortex biosynthesis protein YabQ [Bacillus sp. FJAT-49736]
MSLTTQFYTMLAMIAMGSIFGASLDTYNRFLQRGKRKRWIVFVNDVMFWIIQGLAIFYILFLVNYGEIRFYIFIALVCGFAAYQALMKNIYLNLLEILINTIIAIYQFLVKLFMSLIYNPIKWIILALITISVALGKVLLSLVQLFAKMLLWTLKVIFYPIKWIGTLLWKLVPVAFRKFIEKIFQRLAGILKKAKNKIIYIFKWIRRIFNK